MTKVFRIWKFMQDMYEIGHWWTAVNCVANKGWPRKCEGMTKQQAAAHNIVILDDWMTEEYL